MPDAPMTPGGAMAPGGGQDRGAGVPSGPVLRVLPPAGWVRRVTRTAGGSLAGAGSVHLLERNIRVYRHVWPLFVSGIAEPLFYLLSLGVGLGPLVGHVTGPGGAAVPYREFVAPGLLAVSAMNGAIYDSTFNVYLKLKYVKIYEAMLAGPMRPADIALGEIGWAVLRDGVYAIAFMAVMAAMGLVQSFWALLAVPVALLIGFAFAAVGMACTTFMRSWQDFDYVLLASLPLFLFSATFYPLSVFPRPLAVIVECTPLYQGVVVLRGLILGVVGPGLLWRAAYLVVMGVLGLAISSRRIARLLLT
jgi:lipooligosaccharide transport system permease protein